MHQLVGLEDLLKVFYNEEEGSKLKNYRYCLNKIEKVLFLIPSTN
jgi:hypothetical protein